MVVENHIGTAPYIINEELDEIDLKIIDALRENARMPFAQIAQRLNVSAGMIRFRYNRLIEKKAVQIVAITNPLNMGYNAMALIGVRIEGSKLLETTERIAQLEEVVYLVISSGHYDVFLEVMCRDQANLLHFLTEKLYKIDGVLESDTFIHLKIVKELYE